MYNSVHCHMFASDQTRSGGWPWVVIKLGVLSIDDRADLSHTGRTQSYT